MKLNSTQKLSMRGFIGHFPHSKMGIFLKNRMSRFWESPFLLGLSVLPLQFNSPLTFLKVVVHKIFGILWIAGIITFQKSNICPSKLLEISELFENSLYTLPIFSKFRLWSQIWERNSKSFMEKFSSLKVQLITFPKRFLLQNWSM
jgi:hypothetical protein